jgi:thiol-disulfide isomerase/thioredoxin
MRALALLAVLSALCAVARAAPVELDDSAFRSTVGHGRPVLVEFYLPTCPHCQRLAPAYEQAASSLAGSNVVVARINGQTSSVSDAEGVNGFPTLIWYPAGSTRGQKWEGPYGDADNIVNFVKQRMH